MSQRCRDTHSPLHRASGRIFSCWSWACHRVLRHGSQQFDRGQHLLQEAGRRQLERVLIRQLTRPEKQVIPNSPRSRSYNPAKLTATNSSSSPCESSANISIIQITNKSTSKNALRNDHESLNFLALFAKNCSPPELGARGTFDLGVRLGLLLRPGVARSMGISLILPLSRGSLRTGSYLCLSA